MSLHEVISKPLHFMFKTILCKKCNMPLNKKDKFCSNCGKKVI